MGIASDVLEMPEIADIEPVFKASVPHRVATDEEARTAYSYAISKHKKAFEELAKYDKA